MTDARKLQTFMLQLSCGCCDDEAQFFDQASADAALAKAGLGCAETVVDDAGQTIHKVDTFYGARPKEEPRRSLGYLADQVSKLLPPKG